MINIITGISMVGIGVGALALVVVLSAFNGLEDLVEGLYSSFDPDIKIVAKKGKTFDTRFFPVEKVKQIEGVEFTSRSLEENVLLKYKDKQSVATIKGVDPSFADMSGIDSMMYEGTFSLQTDSQPLAVVGYGIAANLSVFIGQVFEHIKFYAAKRTGQIMLSNPDQAFRVESVVASGIFAISPDFDEKYVLVPYDFAAKLLDYNTEVSAIEVGLKKGASEKKVKEALQKLVGEEYEVKTRYELNELIFKTNRTEKWITFLILSFILVIATFNVIGSLTMLVIEKKRDIYVLKSMGADKSTVRKIFLAEGMLINLIGGCSGLLLGFVLCWAQQTFGLVRLEGVIVEYYPVLIQCLDFVAVFSTVLVIGFIASWLPVRYVVKRYY